MNELLFSHTVQVGKYAISDAVCFNCMTIEPADKRDNAQSALKYWPDV